MPENIQLIARQPVTLRLINDDLLAPHNFTLKDAQAQFDFNIDVIAEEAVDVPLTPLVTGRYTFYCRNKLWLTKSHREKGMHGTLTVISTQ